MQVSLGPAIGIVQARGGSKGLPRKNVLSLDGHPLIAYSIAAALAAESVDRVICSPDDDQTAAVAAEYGAETLRRPAVLAQADPADLPVYQHALGWLRETGTNPRCLVQLRPT